MDKFVIDVSDLAGKSFGLGGLGANPAPTPARAPVPPRTPRVGDDLDLVTPEEPTAGGLDCRQRPFRAR
jgi:hypothetical protein